MNDDVRKLNSLKITKKKRNYKKNLVAKLSTGAIKIEKPKTALTAKGSFVQEFKKIRKEIENELKREDMKYKSRGSTTWVSPKNMTHTGITKHAPENLDPHDEEEDVDKKRSLKRFMKQKKKKFK